MHDNPPAVSTADFPLSDHHVISLTGRDAVAFAQAQFMNDVSALITGHWQWNGWLTPKGRVIALFALLRIQDDQVWLLLPDTDAVAIVAALQRFVFRSKVVIAVRDDLVSAAFSVPQTQGARLGGSVAGIVELDMSGAAGPRQLCIGANAPADDGLLLRWRAFDLLHGLPRLPASQIEHWTPQQLSLERLRAFSIKKGCYPGQEIVARTHFLGKAKRGLMLVESRHPLAAGAQLHAAGSASAIGTLVACAGIAADRCLALVVVPLEREAGELVVDGLSVAEVALSGGLAR